MLLSSLLGTVTVRVFLFSFSGGDAAEVRLQPAELLDDPVPEATEYQTTVSAYAGVEMVMKSTDQHNEEKSNVTIFMFLPGGWRGE